MLTKDQKTAIVELRRLWKNGMLKDPSDQFLTKKRNLIRNSHRIYNIFLSKGLIYRLKACNRCRLPKKVIQGHHYDYSNPIGIEWLCVSCHVLEHSKIKKFGLTTPESHALQNHLSHFYQLCTRALLIFVLQSTEEESRKMSESLYIPSLYYVGKGLDYLSF